MPKDCRKCGVRKSRNAFYATPLNRDGCMGKCKECHKAAMKKNRRTNPAVQAAERQRAKLPHRRAKATIAAPRWREKNPQRYRAQNAINNAIRDGKLKRGACSCGAKKNVFGIPADPKKPLQRVGWKCARCYHRGRFAA